MTDRKLFRRLPTAVVPCNYVIRLHPDVVSFTFTGQEDISVEITESVTDVTLNCLDIRITSAKFTTKNASLIGTTTYNVEAQVATIHFPEALSLGTGQLSLKFTGELNDKLKGFYRSKYTHPNGETRYAAVTQFEPTEARRAFPCWDEPALKATFEITLVALKNQVALSNMVRNCNYGKDPTCL
ncbi:puromycin-sensitive aminopeptidase-like protein [Corticium candelabrum]|uniref:puromycin-sensitive aminopeptidase-like protein n=1 Tax=Corticium candelabrum TaxID=121492 RepID=UPI002E25CC81|nr:puromycin-sensitive aminopeptidase-like protein [Corticium candelabrum]